ncbi:hypothetical protein H1C71_001543, partial [Ictidomys tridecemlineatus]|uniref:G-protein coupled receptors family 1 profile domain-containing protein n=1 Tax=Ictidomys tridecemlineatus TaxID=43179 RepID=A0A287DF42_ICTTR
MANCTQVSEFVLLGFRGGQGMQKVLFLVFLVLYVVAMVGNLGMIVIIRADAHLQTPMHGFLQSLSFLDVCYSSTIVPRALVNCLKDDRRVSFAGCASQFFFLSLAFLLAAMTTMTFRLSFCGPNEINDFFCDVPPLLSLSCSDTSENQWVLLGLCGSIIVSTFLVVLVSYICIISAILKIHTVQGRHRAFSTCASHLTGVCLFFWTVFFMYAQPSAISSLEQSKVVSIFYTVVIPMLNPLIYSLRNKDVKQALKRGKWKFS